SERGARRAREGRPDARDARRPPVRAFRRRQARRVARLHQARLAVGDRTLSGHVLTPKRDSGFGIRGSGVGVRGSRFGVRDSVFGITVSGCGTNPKSRIPNPDLPYHLTRNTSCTILAWLAPRSCVIRKLSALEPTVALLVSVPLFATGPWLPLGKKVCVNPSGVPAVDPGLKYGVLKAFSISARNSNVTRPGTRRRLGAPMSKRTSGGPLTTRLRTPQSP